MDRSLDALGRKTYDVLVVGGGVYGAAAAWDAALRGLSTALIERDDFGGRTSANSLKVVHGGLRYIQHGDLRRMRESIRERRVLSKIAPHLVRPLPCLLPTYGYGTKGRAALGAALRIADWVGFDRNEGLEPARRLPAGRTLSRKECLQLLPGARREGLTGGALWYDCQMQSPERLTLSFVLSAAAAGADAANHLEVDGFIREGDRIAGVEATDLLDGCGVTVRARMVLNAAGPWVEDVLGLLREGDGPGRVPLTKAMNLLVRRPLTGGVAAGVFRRGGPVYFIAPWRGFSLVGTVHAPHSGGADGLRITEREIQEFIDEINLAYPAASLRREDVVRCYSGLLPGREDPPGSGRVNLWKHYRLRDHARESGLEGLISVVGVKYTTARDVAEKAVDLAVAKLGLPRTTSRTAEAPLQGGEMESFEEYIAAEARSGWRELPSDLIRRLVSSYGTAYRAVFEDVDDGDALQPLAEGTDVRRAEVLYAVRREMARRLSDVVFRRTDLGALGDPGEAALESCAAVMAGELDWDYDRTRREVAECREAFQAGPAADFAPSPA